MITENCWLETNLLDRLSDKMVDFKVSLKPYNFEKVSFEESCRRTACKIRDEHSKIYLSFSGGLDSVYVFNIFIKYSIPFTPVCVFYKDGLSNAWELQRGIELCIKHGIKPKMITPSAREYCDTYQDRIFNTIRGYGTTSQHSILVGDMALRDGAVVVTGEDMIEDESLGELGVDEYNFYLDLCSPQIGIPFFLYSLETVDAVARYSVASGMKRKELKAELYNDPTPKKVRLFDNELGDIINRCTRGLRDEKNFHHSFGSSQDLYEYLTPWRTG